MTDRDDYFQLRSPQTDAASSAEFWQRLYPIVVPVSVREHFKPEELDRLLDLSLKLKRLSALANRELSLTLTSNRKRIISLKVHQRSTKLELRLLWALTLDLPGCVLLALSILRSGRLPDYSRDWFMQLLARPEIKARLQHKQRVDKLPPRDEQLYDELRQVSGWLGMSAPPPDTWVGWMTGAMRADGRRIRLGRANPESGTIHMHPLFKLEEVPDHCRHSTLFHELCHLVAPPLTQTEAKRLRTHRIHHREFRRLEALDPMLVATDTWLRENLRWVTQLAQERGLI